MTPGITDTNKLRVEATHDSIRKCQALWYVATVDRICTDPDLEHTVGDYGQRFGNNLAIVVTKIDEGVGHELAMDLQSKGQNLGDVEEWYDAIVNLKRPTEDGQAQVEIQEVRLGEERFARPGRFSRARAKRGRGQELQVSR